MLLFMGCVSKKGQLAIVTQWCEGSSLYKVQGVRLKCFHVVEKNGNILLGHSVVTIMINCVISTTNWYKTRILHKPLNRIVEPVNKT